MLGSRRLRKIDEKTDGHKFAITFSAAILGFIYSLFNYTKNTAIDKDFYLFICEILSMGVLTLFIFFIYFIIKGYSMEEKNRKRDHLNMVASYFFRAGISFFVIMLLFNILFFFAIFSESRLMSVTYILLVIIFMYVVVIEWTVFKDHFNPKSKRGDVLKFVLNLFIYMCVIMIIIYYIFPIVVNIFYISPLQGHVTIEMQSVYYKSNLELPALIWITGLDTGLNISLLKEASGNLSEITNISLGPGSIDKYIKTNNYILANGLGNGKYNIFINTTNLYPGYYELRGERKYEISNKSDVKGFFLLNSSES